MDFFTSAHNILSLPISEKERNHHSRNRRAYHVYLSQFFKEYNELNDDEKRAKLIELRVWRPPEGYDSDDSVMTAPIPGGRDVMRAAGRVWNRLNIQLKDAWRERTTLLNARPANDGIFQNVPAFVNDNVVKDALTRDWRYLVSLLKQSIMSNAKKFTQYSETTYVFGRERVVLNKQGYRSFYLSHLLKLSLFGSPLYSNLLGHEIIYRKKNQTIVFFYSHRRISDLFVFGGLNGTEFLKDGMNYICCLKANLRNQRGRNIIGYVMDEIDDTLLIKVDGQRRYVEIERLQYDGENGRFIYVNGTQADHYSLTELWPLRMKLNRSGQSYYIISTHCYGVDNDPEYIT